MEELPKIIVVMVAYNAGKTIERTVRAVPAAAQIICVDDRSRDDTVKIARMLHVNVLSHAENRGYGAAQKTGYAEALRLDADIIVLLHADYQYDPLKIPELVRPILEKRADMVFGSRMMDGGALKGGMPLWKYYANMFSTALANIVFGMRLSEYHSGFRAYSSDALRAIDFGANSNSYIFDAEMIAQAVSKRFVIAEIPVAARYFKEASSIGVWPCMSYGLGFFKILLKSMLTKP